eukprot:2353083-Amphidinium_carterae.2
MGDCHPHWKLDRLFCLLTATELLFAFVFKLYFPQLFVAVFFSRDAQKFQRIHATHGKYPVP